MLKKGKKKDKELEKELEMLSEMSDSAAEMIIESELGADSLEGEDDEVAESKEIIKEYQKSVRDNIMLPTLREKEVELPILEGDIMEQLKILMQHSQQFQEMEMMYACAIREVQTKAEVLNDEMSVRYHRNPISSISSRVKSPESIAQKLYKKGLPFTVEAIMTNLTDVAGVRIICEFVDDIYSIAAMIAMQDDLKLIKVKDYIKYPKPNGYRSYHMIVEIPVFFSKGKTPMCVEIQIRTMAMDFWASLDHELKYKKDIDPKDEELIANELHACAERIAETDDIMQQIRMKLDSVADKKDVN
jgi:putative GTP pyrophosphokinase